MRLPPVEFADFGSALEQDSWLWDYVRWGARQTDAPLASHLVGALCALASIAPRNLMFRPHIGAPVHAALWCMIIGPSGLGRKSTVVRFATDLIRDVDPNLLGHAPDSAEGLMEEIAAQPRLTLAYSEFGEFLAKTMQGSRQEQVRTLQAALYDGVTLSRRLARRTVIIDNPRLTILAAVSDTYVERYLRDEDFTGGWGSRYTFIGGISEHEPEQQTDPVETDRQRNSLLLRLRRANGRKIIGPSNLTDEAWALWIPWTRDLTARAKSPTCNPWLRGAITRAHEIAIKVAMLNAMVERRANDTGWALALADVRIGRAVADASLRTLSWLVAELSTTPYQRQRRDLIEQLRVAPMTRPAIARHFRLPRRRFEELLTSVEAEGLLASFQNAKGTTIFTLRTLDVVLAEEGDPVPPPIEYDLTTTATILDFDAKRRSRDEALREPPEPPVQEPEPCSTHSTPKSC